MQRSKSGFSMKPDVGGDAEAPAGMGPPAEEGTALQTEGEQQGHGRGGGGGESLGAPLAPPLLSSASRRSNLSSFIRKKTKVMILY